MTKRDSTQRQWSELIDLAKSNRKKGIFEPIERMIYCCDKYIGCIEIKSDLNIFVYTPIEGSFYQYFLTIENVSFNAYSMIMRTKNNDAGLVMDYPIVFVNPDNKQKKLDVI